MPYQSKPKIYNSGYTLELIEEDIVCLVLDGTKLIEKEDAIQIRDLVLELVDNKKFKVLIDFRGVNSATNMEARKFVSNNKNFKYLKICEAFITDSFSTSMLIGMYIKLFTPKTPTKSFSNFDAAIKWVKSF